MDSDHLKQLVKKILRPAFLLLALSRALVPSVSYLCMSAEIPASKKICTEGAMSRKSVTFVTGNAKKLAEV